MQKKRLLKLADLLEADAKNKTGVQFDLKGWGAGSGDEPSVDCGTKACAIGLACISGEFKKSGLSYRMMRGGGRWTILPAFDDTYGFAAVQKFFGLTSGQAENIFHALAYDTTSQTGAKGERAVAKRIRELVASS
jgi:hypothetical protein